MSKRSRRPHWLPKQSPDLSGLRASRSDDRALRQATSPRQAMAKLTFHTDPATVSKQHTAVLTALLSVAFRLGQTIPNASFPIHLTVEFGGASACGLVEPADETETAPSPSDVAGANNKEESKTHDDGNC